MATTAPATTPLHTLTQLHKLEERYPFSEEELEILTRCHDHIKENASDDYLMKLALASPYSYFFLPGDEMRDRVDWIENHLLPPGFANQFRAAISTDAFVEYANQGEEKSLERFLEGIADTGRRGTKEALRVLFRLLNEDATPESAIDLCVRLAIAREALIIPVLDKKAFMKHLDDMAPAVQNMAKSLEAECYGKPLTMRTFIDWAEDDFPMLSTPLSSFVHSLLFHGHPYPESRVPFTLPRLEHASDIFSSSHSPLLMSLLFTSPQFGGKWHRLYSSFLDGRSFDNLEHALRGYGGPTVLVARTTGQAVLGAFAAEPWKESKHFHGNADCFLFQLVPKLAVYRAVGDGEQNFMYLHSKFFNGTLQPEDKALPHGIGFGGTSTKPRLFIPESLEKCSAEFLDKTFKSGDLLPMDALEKFEIQHVEVWGVGGEETILQALEKRTEYRERMGDAILKARVVHDKSRFAEDMKSGFIPSDVFSFQEQVRGRSDFSVDDEHGGYKIDRD